MRLGSTGGSRLQPAKNYWEASCALFALLNSFFYSSSFYVSLESWIKLSVVLHPHIDLQVCRGNHFSFSLATNKSDIKHLKHNHNCLVAVALYFIISNPLLSSCSSFAHMGPEFLIIYPHFCWSLIQVMYFSVDKQNKE